MGPPREHGGDVGEPAEGGLAMLKLQWGRRENTAEIWVSLGMTRGAWRLQWGRRENTAEICHR